MLRHTATLEPDRRFRQGGYLFLASLVMFFLATILLYGLYAYWRRGDAQSQVPLPASFLVSTGLLVFVSVIVHMATRTIRREKRRLTSVLLLASAIAATIFVSVQCYSMENLMTGPGLSAGTSRGIAGMVVVLAILHALHVAGGIIALAIVSVKSWLGFYDHERHWPIDFAAQYWHFLDLVWLCMLAAFWGTSGGF